jgi:predicted ATPase/class 3 adenylate cyclase
MSSELPTGTLTYLFTDLEGSTQLWERHPEAMQAALARHDTILQMAVETYQGKIVKTTGDGLHAVFVSASDGVCAALSAQEVIKAENWADIEPLRVRMALHTGEAQLRAGDYYGSAVNRAARLMGIGHGGQILLSQATATLIKDALPPEADMLDLGDHRLNDLTSIEYVYQLSHPKLTNHFPPLRSLGTYAHNLPLQLNSFVGRERELEAITGYLSETRLLTLFGVGGTGKTRLMLQVAAQVLDKYQDGVWLVELASLTDPAQVLERVASIFSLREQPGQPLLETLTDYLRYKQSLLLLDNCEHLVAASAQLVEHLLRACPKLTVLVTSREGLAIGGEVTFQVPSLSLPAQEQTTLDDLLNSECVQLFAERAQAATPSFKTTPENALYIAQICRRLDGIPLAIELAAARVQVLSVEQIASRLQDRFRLLTGGSRTALPRQQTLQALIDWSWDLLSEPERHLLRHLSVFSGGWSLAAAEMVAGGHSSDSPSTDPLDVLEDLTQLVAKSLVVAERGSQDGIRYGMLESIRHYAHDRLVEADEAAQLRDQHAEYFSQYIIDAEQDLRGPEMATWLKRLEIEHDNLRAAMEWSLETRPKLVLLTMAPLVYTGGWISNTSEIRGWLEQALDYVNDQTVSEDKVSTADIVSQVKALFLLAWINFRLGEYTACQAAAEEAITLAQRIGARRELAYGLQILSLAFAYLGNLDKALKDAHEAITINRQNGSKWELSLALSSISVIYTYTNELDQARSFAQEGLTIAQEIGNTWSIGLCLRSLALIAAQQGDVQEALIRFEQSVKMFEKQGNMGLVVVARSDMAHFLRRQGEIQAARAIYEQTIQEWFDFGSRPAVAHQLECFAYLAISHEEPIRAATLLGAAEFLREASSSLRMGEEQEEYDQAVAQLRDKLDEDETLDALNTGRAMTIEQAIPFALEDNKDKEISEYGKGR